MAYLFLWSVKRRSTILKCCNRSHHATVALAVAVEAAITTLPACWVVRNPAAGSERDMVCRADAAAAIQRGRMSHMKFAKRMDRFGEGNNRSIAVLIASSIASCLM